MACRYNCHAGYSNWYFGWSAHKKSWCCDHNSMGCPGTWHGSYHLETHVTHGVGHAQGRIYDCNAGFSNWKQGWSNSKQEWCCTHEKRGCMKYHCDGDAPWQDFGSNSRGRLRHWRPQSSRRHRFRAAETATSKSSQLATPSKNPSPQASMWAAPQRQWLLGPQRSFGPWDPRMVRQLKCCDMASRASHSSMELRNQSLSFLGLPGQCGRSLGVLGMFWCVSSWLMAPHM